MEYRTLTETLFFKYIGDNATIDSMEIDNAFHEFITKTLELCGNPNVNPHMPLMYAEIELQHLERNCMSLNEEKRNYVQKSLSFISKLQQHLATKGLLAVQKSTTIQETDSAPPLKWTGNAVDLVEMVYGISVMGCVNDGKTPLRDMAALLYKFFGINAKDCYRFYVDIRRRKNDDRTYFLNEMCERLNEKMRADDKKDAARG